MSHFVGLVFGSDVDNLLAPYDENEQVAEHVEFTKEEAIAKVKSEHLENFEYMRDRLEKGDLDGWEKEYYSKRVELGPFLTADEAWEFCKDWGYEIDEDENLISTYNPESKWDWYEMGGRWSGFLKLKIGDVTNQAHFSEIDWESTKLPYCFITNEGEWNERGEMGWFGVSTNEVDKDVWEQQFKQFLSEQDPDEIVTVIDFHI